MIEIYYCINECARVSKCHGLSTLYGVYLGTVQFYEFSCWLFFSLVQFCVQHYRNAPHRQSCFIDKSYCFLKCFAIPKEFITTRKTLVKIFVFFKIFYMVRFIFIFAFFGVYCITKETLNHQKRIEFGEKKNHNHRYKHQVYWIFVEIHK